MVDPTTRLGRFLAALRSRTGRRLLVLALVVSVGFVAWWFVGRLPGEGTVEVRWTENAPSSVAVTYINSRGDTVRYRREVIPPGTDRFRDAYELPADRYWLRIEVRLPNGVRSVRKRVELPSPDPYVLFVDELFD
jgi:hypothetical protein